MFVRWRFKKRNLDQKPTSSCESSEKVNVKDQKPLKKKKKSNSDETDLQPWSFASRFTYKILLLILYRKFRTSHKHFRNVAQFFSQKFTALLIDNVGFLVNLSKINNLKLSAEQPSEFCDLLPCLCWNHVTSSNIWENRSHCPQYTFLPSDVTPSSTLGLGECPALYSCSWLTSLILAGQGRAARQLLERIQSHGIDARLEALKELAKLSADPTFATEFINMEGIGTLARLVESGTQWARISLVSHGDDEEFWRRSNSQNSFFFFQLRRDVGLHSHRLPGAHGPRHRLLGLDLSLLHQTGYYWMYSLSISEWLLELLNLVACSRLPATWTSRWWTCPSCSARWPSWRAWCSTATASTTGWRKRSPWDSSSGTCKCEHTHTHRGTVTHSDTAGRGRGGQGCWWGWSAGGLCSQQPVGGTVCRGVSTESERNEANNEVKFSFLLIRVETSAR